MAILPSSPGIYKITCTANDKIYIGSSAHMRQRWNEHRSYLQRGKHHNRHLQFAWNKYGESAFVFGVLELVMFVEYLHEREQYWLDHFRAYDRRCGFNLARDARAPARGYKASPALRAKYARRQLGRRHPDAVKEKIRTWNIGRVMSSDARDKMRIAWQRRRAELTPEQWYQRTAASFHSPEARARMAAAKSARWIVTDPQGNECVVESLRAFCEGHGLSYSNMKIIAKHPGWTHKKYRCRHA
jgi:group I intron endonuclease